MIGRQRQIDQSFCKSISRKAGLLVNHLVIYFVSQGVIHLVLMHRNGENLIPPIVRIRTLAVNPFLHCLRTLTHLTPPLLTEMLL